MTTRELINALMTAINVDPAKAHQDVCIWITDEDRIQFGSSIPIVDVDVTVGGRIDINI